MHKMIRKGGVSYDYVTGAGCLIEVIQRLIPKKTYTSVIYPSQKPDEKMQAFKELVATRSEAKKYLPDDFDPDAELEAARREKYGSID